jgi:radical SAM protein with 4Fe4S-binding SPASM domain
MHDLPQLLEALHATGIAGWQLQITAPFGNAGDNPHVLLQPYMYPELFALLDTLVDRAEALGIRIWPANNLGYFGPLEAKLRTFQKKGAHYKGCGAGRVSMGIEADGAIKGCPSLGGPENVGGHWRDLGLRAIWGAAPQLTYMRERTENELWGYCAECYYRATCRAGCTTVAEPLMGRPGNNPFCHHRAMEMERMGLRERIEQVEKGPGLPFDHGLYRIIREHKDPARRGREGPVRVDEPRTSRSRHRMGIGEPVG